MTLNDILQAAQGGQGVDTLANQFGLTPAQAQAAVQALLPAFSTAMQQTTANMASIGGLMAQIAAGAHQGVYTDPAQTSAAAGPGGAALGQIFGSPQVIAQIAQQAALASGVSAQVIAEMMPVVASMILGGLTHAMSAQGFGGVLAQLASALTAPGGLGSAPNAGAAGGLGGLMGSVLGSLLGGAQQSANAQSAALQAGLNSLSSMLQAGVQVSQAHQQGLSDILQSVSGQPKQS